MKNIDYSVYLVTDSDICNEMGLLSVCENAIKGGATLIQLREKDLSSRAFFEEAAALKKICENFNVPFIINDRLDIAQAVDADGVHIGQSDLPLKTVRNILGDKKIIGVSCGNVDEALAAQKDGADYLGVGAVFHTDTKKDANDVGIEMLKKVKAAVQIPVVGIGGINLSNIEKLYGTGIEGVAVVSCIMASDDPYLAAKELSGKTKNL